MKIGLAMKYPKRRPGKIVLEKESRRITRPSVSMERKDGVSSFRNCAVGFISVVAEVSDWY